MLEAPPSGPRPVLPRRSKSAHVPYTGDNDSSGLSDQGEDDDATTPTPTAAGGEQETPFAGGAFDGAGEDVQNQNGVKEEGVVANGVVTGTLTPQGKTLSGATMNGNGNKQANSAKKRVIKVETPVDDSEDSDFHPDLN